MIDPFGRHITYLRVSVTDRCDFRCVYCMSEHMTFLPKAELLTLEELERLCGAFVAQGRRAAAHHRRRAAGPAQRHQPVRPAGRADRQVEPQGSDADDQRQPALALRARPGAAGVKRINVSLDTLDTHKFQTITRWGELDKVLDGIDAADAAGLKIKINTVALQGRQRG